MDPDYTIASQPGNAAHQSLQPKSSDWGKEIRQGLRRPRSGISCATKQTTIQILLLLTKATSKVENTGYELAVRLCKLYSVSFWTTLKKTQIRQYLMCLLQINLHHSKLTSLALINRMTVKDPDFIVIQELNVFILLSYSNQENPAVNWETSSSKCRLVSCYMPYEEEVVPSHVLDYTWTLMHPTNYWAARISTKGYLTEVIRQHL